MPLWRRIYYKTGPVNAMVIVVMLPLVLCKIINVEFLYDILTFPYAPFYLIPYVFLSARLSILISDYLDLFDHKE